VSTHHADSPSDPFSYAQSTSNRALTVAPILSETAKSLIALIETMQLPSLILSSSKFRVTLLIMQDVHLSHVIYLRSFGIHLRAITVNFRIA
jgi:hypothetical protein